MKVPPIRLLEQHYDSISVKAVRAHRPGDGPGWKLQTTLSLRQNPEEERIWALLFEIVLGQEEDKPAIPYEIAVQATGTFEVHAEIPADEMAKLVAITGTSILYSGFRDFVATVTGRGPWGPYLLPTVSFTDIEPETKLEKQADRD